MKISGLKKIIAKHALEIEFKDELLKKAKPTFRKEGIDEEVLKPNSSERSLQVAYLCLTGEQAAGRLVANSFEESVQLLGV